MDIAHVVGTLPTRLHPEAALLVPAGNGHPDRKIPVQSMYLWTETERNAISVYEILPDTTPIPPSKKVDDQRLVYDQASNTVTLKNILSDMPISQRKATMRTQVENNRKTVSEAGYNHDFGAGLGGVHALDTAERNKSSWIDYRNACKEKIDAGQGSAVMEVPIRTKAEVDLLVRANQGMAAMQGMRTREGNVILKARQLNDQIRNAADHAALDAINIDAGWPT